MTMADQSAGGRVVVGVDGSKGARAALSWAIAEACQRKATLDVVFAWDDLGVRIAREGGWAKAVTKDMEEQAADDLVRDELRAVLGDSPEPEVQITTVPGDGANALIDASNDADLLVVGSRGMGGFQGLLLGSVSHKCIQHARCPVVVVPTD